MSETHKTRLLKLQLLLIAEEKSSNPSDIYIADLRQSIKDIKYQIKLGNNEYEMVVT